MEVEVEGYSLRLRGWRWRLGCSLRLRGAGWRLRGVVEVKVEVEVEGRG